jgi:hypothetical protein
LPNTITDPEDYLVDVAIFISGNSYNWAKTFFEQEGINNWCGLILFSWGDIFERLVPPEERRIPTRFSQSKVIFI